jgi:N,N'-diacetyllegionaminate synthase
MKPYTIAGKQIGFGYEPFIILEAGINHNGDMTIIHNMINTAANSGADALKFQTFKATEFISDPTKTYTYFSQGREITESMLEMFQRYELSAEQWRQVVTWCRDAGLIFFSTPQNPTDLDFLLGFVDLPVIKVGSDDLTNTALLTYYASKNIPMLISAGMAYLSEVEAAVRAIRDTGNQQVAILHCISSYPAEPDELHLKKMNTLSVAFDLPVGFSDHTIGCNAAVAAVALGACIIEKHFTLDKNLPGPDHWFSADAKEIKEWVRAIHDTYRALGKSVVEPTPKEFEMRKIARRSIVAARDLSCGTILQLGDIAFKRPGTGLSPTFASNLAGLQLLHECKKDAFITFNDVGGMDNG